MKRIISVLLATLVIITAVGCSQQTDEERKAELKAEIKEELQKELDQEKVEEQSKDTAVLKGRLIVVGSELGHGIMLDDVNDINGNEVSELFFEDKHNILNFVPREYITYYTEGRTSLKEELSGEIPIEILVNLDSYYVEDERPVGYVEISEVISVNGEEPIDRSNEEYPDSYYIDLFERSIIAMPDEVIQPNIKDMKIYTSDEGFKQAVDILLKRGYFIDMGEGVYYINETQQNYIDGEVDEVEERP